MAHRHTVQKRARGGRNLGPDYSGPASKRILDEAKSQEEDFNKGGKTVAKAHGGAAKKSAGFKRGGRSQPFAKGGSVWSHAAGGLRGKKGFAGEPEVDGHEDHGEKLDRKSHGGGTEGKKHRMMHKGKAKHQYAEGGRAPMKDGGHPKDKVDEDPSGAPHGEWEREHAAGGRTKKNRGGECDEKEED